MEPSSKYFLTSVHPSSLRRYFDMADESATFTVFPHRFSRESFRGGGISFKISSMRSRFLLIFIFQARFSRNFLTSLLIFIPASSRIWLISRLILTLMTIDMISHSILLKENIDKHFVNILFTNNLVSY